MSYRWARVSPMRGVWHSLLSGQVWDGRLHISLNFRACSFAHIISFTARQVIDIQLPNALEKSQLPGSRTLNRIQHSDEKHSLLILTTFLLTRTSLRFWTTYYLQQNNRYLYSLPIIIILPIPSPIIELNTSLCLCVPFPFSFEVNDTIAIVFTVDNIDSSVVYGNRAVKDYGLYVE